MKNEEFNMVITGTGGQGLITLLQIIAEAALAEGKEVRTSELHGLSQRGGSVEVHIRFGKEIFSPLVAQGAADLVLGLEIQESLKGLFYANPDTNFLINRYAVPIPLEKSLSEKEVLKFINKISQKIEVVPANEICQKQLKNSVVAGIYLVGLAVSKKLIPLDFKSVLKAVKKIIPAKYLELNAKAFDLSSKLS